MRNGKICANVKDLFKKNLDHEICSFCELEAQNPSSSIDPKDKVICSNYPIIPHMFHREKATNISICAYNRPSNDMIRRQSKINVCKLTRNSVFDTCQGGPNSRGLIVSEGF